MKRRHQASAKRVTRPPRPPLAKGGRKPVAARPADARQGDRPQRRRGLQSKFAIVINCDSESQQLELLEQFERNGIDCRALVV